MAISQNFPNTRPSLNLNFARSKTLDPRITFSRSNTTATYVDDNGLIVDAGVDEPRFDHDPTTGESLGLLVEEQRTNLITYNNDFTLWTKQTTGSGVVGVAVTDATTSPDGTNNSSKFYVDTAGGSFYNIYRNIGINSNTDYTYSVFAKQAESTRIDLTVYTGLNGGNQYVNYNLSNGTVTGITTSGTNTGISTAGIIPYPNDWYRCHMTFNVNESISVQYKLGNGTTTLNEGIYIYGAQIEAGAFPTSYIPTSGSQVTRTTDNVSMTGTNFSDWFNSSEGAIVVDSLVEYNPEATKFVYGISGGSYDLSLRQPHLTGARFRAVIGGTFSSSPGTGNNAVNGSTTKAAVAYTSSTGRLQVGDSGVDVTPGGAVDGNQLSIGVNNGRIKQLTYYPTRLSNTVLQTLTK